MNYNIDTALCIGGACPDQNKCARSVVYQNMQAAHERGEIKFNPRVVITTPPFTYNDGCSFYMPTEQEPKA